MTNAKTKMCTHSHRGRSRNFLKGGTARNFLRGGGCGCPCERRKSKALSQSAYRKKIFCRYKGGGAAWFKGVIFDLLLCDLRLRTTWYLQHGDGAIMGVVLATEGSFAISSRYRRENTRNKP